MAKNSYLKSLLVLLLISGSLFGYQQPASSNSETILTQVTQENKSQSLEIEQIKTAYNKFKGEKTKFIGQLKKAATDQASRLSTKSDKLSKELNNLQKELKNFREQELTKLQGEKKKKAEEIINKIDAHLKEMSEKVIDPLKNGLTKDKVEIVQKQLDFFVTQNIPAKYYGVFGPKTNEQINKFLTDKQTELDKEIKALNEITNGTPEKTIEQISEELNALKKDNQIFKIIFLISSVFATGLIIFTFDKNRRMSKNIGRGLNKKHQEALSHLYNELKKDLDNLQRQQNKSNKEIKQLEETVISTKQTLVNHIKETDKKISENIKNEKQEIDYDKGKKQQVNQPILSNAIEVSETKQSASDRRLGKSQAVILEKKRRGNYLVYTEENCEHLIPSENLSINEYNYKTLEALFECLNYNPNYTTHFQIVQPAIVNSVSSGKTWELIERGVLQF
ncbi:MAG: hypothetical protein QNJ33_05460 [Crocosphaera sp.]|nr:hypothetical protein [Crocosphaera sp.]